MILTGFVSPAIKFVPHRKPEQCQQSKVFSREGNQSSKKQSDFSHLVQAAGLKDRALGRWPNSSQMLPNWPLCTVPTGANQAQVHPSFPQRHQHTVSMKFLILWVSEMRIDQTLKLEDKHILLSPSKSNTNLIYCLKSMLWTTETVPVNLSTFHHAACIILWMYWHKNHCLQTLSFCQRQTERSVIVAVHVCLIWKVVAFWNPLRFWFLGIPEEAMQSQHSLWRLFKICSSLCPFPCKGNLYTDELWYSLGEKLASTYSQVSEVPSFACDIGEAFHLCSKCVSLEFPVKFWALFWVSPGQHLKSSSLFQTWNPLKIQFKSHLS